MSMACCVLVLNSHRLASAFRQDSYSEGSVSNNPQRLKKGQLPGRRSQGPDSWGGSVKYQTCLIFCRSHATSQEITTKCDYVYNTPNPRKIYSYQPIGSSGTPPLK